MSFNSPGYDKARFMPAPVEERLLSGLARIGGFVLIAIVAFIAASLTTWSVTDPSLTHATGGAVSNIAGPVGAIVSDLLIQILGLASIVVLMPLMFWAIDLVSGERVAYLRAKAVFVPLAVFLIAGGLSALPAFSSWPLHHGMGGMIGDVAVNLLSSLFALINPKQAALASGILFWSSGLSCLLRSLGLTFQDIWLARPRISELPSLAMGTESGSWHNNLRAEANRLRQNLTGHLGPAFEPALAAAAPAPPEQAWNTPYGDRPEPVLSGGRFNAWQQTHPMAAPPMAPEAFVPAAPVYAGYPHYEQVEAPMPEPMPEQAYSDAYEYDASEQDPHAIAQRFAAQSPVQEASPARPAMKRPAFLREWSVRAPQKPAAYKRPNVNMLARGTSQKANGELSQTALRGTARLLEDVLADFGVKGEMRDVRPGPIVTLFEFEPARGTKVSRILALADDIARSMSVTSVRVAVVPGRSTIGIELPNVRRETVVLRELLESDAYRNSQAALPIVLGKSIGGDAIIADLARMPHLLVAGTTGSGKSVGVNAMILSLLYRHAPEQCRMLMIDPKMLELIRPRPSSRSIGPSSKWKSATSACRSWPCATSRHSISAWLKPSNAAPRCRAPFKRALTGARAPLCSRPSRSTLSRCPISSSLLTSSQI
jgi:DNA segregation ATPase FtsK/SpoIIIE, S-DNA-T family